MIKSKIKKILSICLIISTILYVIYSQLQIYIYKNKIIKERERVYYIADSMELLKTLLREADGKLDISILNKHRKVIAFDELPKKQTEYFLKGDQRAYTLVYSQASNERKKELDRYFSDIVLHNYFCVVTKPNGKIVEIFWDKP